MGEVEPQAVRGHQGAGLLDVLAQHAAQRRVQQVGGGVVERGGRPGCRVHQEAHRVPLAQAAGADPALVDDQAGGVLHGVGHLDLALRADDAARVAGLAAGLRVERGPLGDHLDLGSGLRLGGFLFVRDQQPHAASQLSRS